MSEEQTEIEDQIFCLDDALDLAIVLMEDAVQTIEDQVVTSIEAAQAVKNYKESISLIQTFKHLTGF